MRNHISKTNISDTKKAPGGINTVRIFVVWFLSIFQHFEIRDSLDIFPKPKFSTIHQYFHSIQFGLSPCNFTQSTPGTSAMGKNVKMNGQLKGIL